MDNITSEIKSDTMASSEKIDELRVEEQGEDELRRSPPLLEVRSQTAVATVALANRFSTALHQLAIGHQLRGYYASRMGGCGYNLPILSAERRASVHGIRGHSRNLRSQCHCYVSRRDGLDVRLCTLVWMLLILLVTQLLVRNTVGRPISPQLFPSSLDLYKVSCRAKI